MKTEKANLFGPTALKNYMLQNSGANANIFTTAWAMGMEAPVGTAKEVGHDGSHSVAPGVASSRAPRAVQVHRDERVLRRNSTPSDSPAPSWSSYRWASMSVGSSKPTEDGHVRGCVMRGYGCHGHHGCCSRVPESHSHVECAH